MTAIVKVEYPGGKLFRNGTFMPNAWIALAKSYVGENDITRDVAWEASHSQAAARTLALRMLDEEQKLVARDDYRISVWGFTPGRRYCKPMFCKFDISESDISRYYKEKALKKRGIF